MACLTTSSLVSGYAIAKDSEVYFYPKNKWVVEQVNDKTCAISNQLNNGYKVQMAGTENGFTNLNIDFRQDSFKANSDYDVSYSIPGVVEKTIPTKAYKKNLIVSDLRGEKEFTDALSSASVLDVTIKNTKFRMYLTGLEAQMLEYNDCISPNSAAIATMKIPQQPKNVEGDIAPAPPLDLSIASQGDASSSEQQDQIIPSHKLRPSHSDTDRYTERLAQQMKEESEKYQPEKLSIEAEGVIEETATMETIIEEETIIEIAEPEASMESSIAEEKHVTTKHIKSAKAVYNVTKLEPMSVDLTQPMEKEITMDSMAEEISLINSASGTNSDDFVTMRNKISSLESQISSLNSKNSMLDDELKTALHDAEEERMSVSSDNWNLERATMKFNESERQIMRLGRQLQTQRAQCQQEKTELENMLFDPTLTNQQQLANLAALESELDKVNSDMYRKQRQYEERIRLLEGQLNAQ